MQKIYFNKFLQHKVELQCKIKDKKSNTKVIDVLVHYESKLLESDPVTIDSKADFFEQHNVKDFYEYFIRLLKPRIQEQLNFSKDLNKNNEAFVSIQFNEEFLCPFEEFEEKKMIFIDRLKHNFEDGGIKLHIYDAGYYL